MYCECGKKCKGLRGLKTHQRTCRFVMGLNEELIQPEQDNELETNDIEDLILTSSNPDLKPGVKLPQTEPEFAFTEDFLRSHLNIEDIQSDSDLDALITNMNDTAYGFLAKNYGPVERGHNIDIELEDTYKNFSKQQLKKELSRLKKFESDNVNKVKFVARLLRKKLAGNLNSTSKVTTIDHNAEITKNFWKYVKNYVEGEKSDNQNASFGKKKCVDYFKSAFKSLSPRRLFVIPSWIPRFKEPEHSFDTSIPTYAEITRIIRKIKSKGSPCPLDQILIILFKRSPYVRSYITSIIQKFGKKGKFLKRGRKL